VIEATRSDLRATFAQTSLRGHERLQTGLIRPDVPP